MTPTPKRKRGQHRARHPWSNAAIASRGDAFARFRASVEGKLLSDMAKPAVIYSCFVAGYLAGKDAK